VIALLVPEMEAEVSLAVMVCEPAVVSVAVTVATPSTNETAPKLAPPRLSESVTESSNDVTTLPAESSAAIVTVVARPAKGWEGSPETCNWLSAYPRTPAVRNATIAN